MGGLHAVSDGDLERGRASVASSRRGPADAIDWNFPCSRTASCSTPASCRVTTSDPCVLPRHDEPAERE